MTPPEEAASPANFVCALEWQALTVRQPLTVNDDRPTTRKIASGVVAGLVPRGFAVVGRRKYSGRGA